MKPGSVTRCGYGCFAGFRCSEARSWGRKEGINTGGVLKAALTPELWDPAEDRGFAGKLLPR